MIINPSITAKARKPRLIAFYLPQFHPIPENDEWWNKGFTEWTNVAKAKPLFADHFQPRLPADLGFYDLRVPETRLAQAEMAKHHGIEGFCYWHYWFAGKRLLEKPFNEVLRLKEPDFPFCLAWANQSWSGIWHGCPDKILIQQTYPGLEDYKAHFYALLGAFEDPRYLTIDDKPIFLVYQPQSLPDSRQFTDYWRTLADQAGLKGIYFIGIIQNNNWDPTLYGFDAFTTSNPNYIFPLHEPRIRIKRSLLDRVYRKSLSILSPPSSAQNSPTLPTLYSYEKAIKSAFIKNNLASENYPCIFPNWDNSPRSGANGKVFIDSTPELFRDHLKEAIEQISSNPPDKKIIFVKSWNEWAEGNYLEPDQKFGTAYLEVIKDELSC